MKKIIAGSILLFSIVGIILGFQVVGAESFKKEQTFEADRIEEVEVNNDSWNIEFKHTESKKIAIEVDGKQKNKKKDPVTIRTDKKKLFINQTGEQRWLSGFSFGREGKITISIPKNKIDQITVHNRDGDMKINDVKTKYIAVSNGSGAGKIEGLTAEEGKFTSKDGELSMKNSSFQELAVDSTTGGNYLTNVISKKMKLNSTDGEVLVKGIEEEKSIFVETKSGDITVAYKEAPQSLMLSAKSDSSDITVDLKGFKAEKKTEGAKKGTIGDASNQLEIVSQDGTIHVK
ncbi:DUF4097 domain-containing protein [Bacillus sp. C1]